MAEPRGFRCAVSCVLRSQLDLTLWGVSPASRDSFKSCLEKDDLYGLQKDSSVVMAFTATCTFPPPQVVPGLSAASAEGRGGAPPGNRPGGQSAPVSPWTGALGSSGRAGTL